jgi:hypothetical protein
MKTTYVQMPDITNYTQLYVTEPISSDLTVMLVYKKMDRSDSVLLDVYLNEISSETKVVSGKLLKPDSTVSLPKEEVDFLYSIYCQDRDGVDQDITNRNLNKFFLEFVLDDGDVWDTSDLETA